MPPSDAAIAPVWFPDCRMMDIPRTPIEKTTALEQLSQQCITQGITRLDTRRNLAVTGASVCATGMHEILHDVTPMTPYAIVGYDGASKQAAGHGTACIRNPLTGCTEDMFFVDVPSIAGTIVSLEHHHARTHPPIHRWTQEATPTSNSGWVTFMIHKTTLCLITPPSRNRGYTIFRICNSSQRMMVSTRSCKYSKRILQQSTTTSR